MKKIWIVVANSSQAKIYRAENVNHLVEHGFFFHDESHMPARDLVSDKKGRETSHNASTTNTYEPKTTIKTKEGMIFAENLASFLEKGCASGECERIHIIAKSPFLGYLRQSLQPNVVQLIGSEIQKDLTQLTAEEIREYLPPVL